MKRNEKYDLFGYIEFVPIIYGFVTPVFIKSDTLFLEVSSNNKIDHFELLPDHYKELVAPGASNKEICCVIGDYCLYAFKNKDLLLFGPSEILVNELKQLNTKEKLDSQTQKLVQNFIKKNDNSYSEIKISNKKIYFTPGINIGIVDDHVLFAKALGSLLSSFKNFNVVLEASNGKDMQQKIGHMRALPDIMIIDTDMPIMNGVETAEWLTIRYPLIKIVALSLDENEWTMLNMIKAGCCAFISKDTHPSELKKILSEVAEKGYYYADSVNIYYRRALVRPSNQQAAIVITEKEKEFLRLACSDKTYKHIAAEMGLGERTLAGYREVLFKKLNVQSRVGLVLEAIRNDLIKL